jgi:hypothetical protein
VRHELLFDLLETYGIPKGMINNIRRLYENVSLKLSSGSVKDMIQYLVGVKQGNAMAPVLFIVLMQAMAETLEDKWKAADIQTVDLSHFKDTQKHRGRMHGQDWKAKGTTFKLNNILYVDDGVFVYNTKGNMIKGAKILRKHMAHFGLIMHIGREGKYKRLKPFFIHHQEQKQPPKT